MQKQDSKYYHKNVSIFSFKTSDECREFLERMEDDWSNYDTTWKEWHECGEGYHTKAAVKKFDAMRDRIDTLHRKEYPAMWERGEDGEWELHA